MQPVITAFEHRGVLGALTFEPVNSLCWAECVRNGIKIKSEPAKWDWTGTQEAWKKAVDDYFSKLEADSEKTTA